MIHRVTDIHDAISYQIQFDSLSGVRLPLDYILLSKSYLLFKGGLPIGGFIVANQDMSRCTAQIPHTSEGRLARENLKKFEPYSELNGYFILVKSRGWILVSVWAIIIMFSRSKHFIFAYEKSNKKLKYYYSVGKPLVIYDGLVNNQEGIRGVHYEEIALISKFGFVRLYLKRFLTRMRKIIWN